MIKNQSKLILKCQSEPVEDHLNNVFRHFVKLIASLAQCDICYKINLKNNCTQRIRKIQNIA